MNFLEFVYDTSSATITVVLFLLILLFRHKKQPLLRVSSAIALLLVTLAGSLPAAEEATPGTSSPALVTAEILESLLQKEKADLAAADARGADFAKRLDDEANRPAQVRQRLTEAKTEQDEVATRLKLPAPADESPENTEARRWELETRYEALSVEIKMLDQELLSQPARVELLEAKRNKAINHKFKKAGIVIAFPQRDLHLDTKGPLHVTIDGVAQASPGEVT